MIFKKILIKLTYPLAWNVAVIFTSHEFHKTPEPRSILPSVERVLIAAIFINRPHQIFLRTIHTCYWRKSINYIISIIYCDVIVHICMLDRSPPFHLIFGYRSVALSLCVFLTQIALLTQTFHNTAAHWYK